MTTEQNKDLMRRFLDTFVSGDHAAILDMLTPDFVAHLPSGPANRDVFVQQSSFFGMAFSDIRFTVHDQIAEEDKVVARATWQATHTGEFQGQPPTGNQISISAYIIDRFIDGKIAEHWSLFDMLSMMQQLGIIPPPQTAE